MSTQNPNPKARPSAEPSLMRRVLFFVVFTAIIAAIVGGTVLLLRNDAIRRLETPRADAVGVAAGVSVRPYVSIPEADVYPAGLAIWPDGAMALSLFGTGGLRKVNADGSLEIWTTLVAPVALLAVPDGGLYAVDLAAPDARVVGKLKYVGADGRSRVVADAINLAGLPMLAQLALDSAGNLYVSDPDTARIWKVTAAGASAQVWWTIPNLGEQTAMPVGLAYHPGENALLVADPGTGTIYRVRMDAEPPSGEPLYRQAGWDVRTLAVDAQGRIYATAWLHENGALYRLEPDGSLLKLAEKFRAPLGMAFRGDKLYVVNSELPRLIQPVKAQPPFTVDEVSVPG